MLVEQFDRHTPAVAFWFHAREAAERAHDFRDVVGQSLGGGVELRPRPAAVVDAAVCIEQALQESEAVLDRGELVRVRDELRVRVAAPEPDRPQRVRQRIRFSAAPTAAKPPVAGTVLYGRHARGQQLGDTYHRLLVVAADVGCGAREASISEHEAHQVGIDQQLLRRTERDR